MTATLESQLRVGRAPADALARLKAWSRRNSRFLFPSLLVLCTLLAFARPLRAGRVTLPLDILGSHYPWSEEAVDTFHGSYPENPPQNPLIQDLLTLDTPWFIAAREELRQGRLPLWNPWQVGGMPLAANDESAVFYVPQLIAFLLPVPVGLQALMLFHRLVVGLGMYLLLRRIRVNRPAACLGGVVLMLSGFYVVWLGYPESMVAVWLPWSLLCVESLVRDARHRRAWAAGLAIVTGLQLTAGHIETSAHVLMATAFYAVFRMGTELWSRARARGASQPLVVLSWIGVGIALGIALAAVQLGPTIQYLRGSYTNAYRSQVTPERPEPLPNLAFWLVPNLSGNPAFTDPIHFPDQMSFDGEYFNYNERTGYVGVGALLLTVIGLVRPDRRFASHRWAFGLMALLAGCLAYGIFPVYQLVMALPVLRQMNHNRVLFVIALSAASLAAIGFDWLTASGWRSFTEPAVSRQGHASRYVGVLVVAVTTLGVLGATLISNQGLMGIVRWLSEVSPGESLPGLAWTRSWILLAFVLLMIFLVVLWCGLARVIEPSLASVAIALLLVADLMIVATHYYPQIPTDQFYPPVPVTEALSSLGSDARFVAGQYDWRERQTSMVPNVGTVYQLRDMNVYDAIIGQRAHGFMDWVDRFGPTYNVSTILLANLAPDYHALAIASVTHVLMPTSDVEAGETSSYLVFQRESGPSDHRLGSISTVLSEGQTFESNTDDLSAVGLYYYRDRSFVAPIVVRVQDVSGRVVREREVNTAELREQGWLVAWFAPIEQARGSVFTVTATIQTGAAAVGSFGFYADPAASVANGRRYEGGQRIEGALRYRLYRSTASAGVHPVWSDSSHTIFALDGARPRAYLANGVVLARDGSEALAALQDLHVPGSDVVIEGSQPLTSAGGTASLVRDLPGDVAVEVDTPSPGVLVLSEGYGDGGWNVDVDGQAQSVLRANYLFQGAAVPAGHHLVHFWYWPIALTIGLGVTGAAVCVLVLLLALDRRR